MSLIMKSSQESDQVKPSLETRLLNWPECFYQEADVKERIALLAAADSHDMTPEDNAIRHRIIDRRYILPKSVKSSSTDRFLQLWLYLMYAINNGKNGVVTKRQAKEVIKLADQIGLDDFSGETADKLLFDEFYQMAMLYINLSMSDKQYGSVLFGFGRMKGDRLSEKVAADFYKAAYLAPQAIEFSHRDVWTEALTKAYKDFFPSKGQYLQDLIDGRVVLSK